MCELRVSLSRVCTRMCNLPVPSREVLILRALTAFQASITQPCKVRQCYRPPLRAAFVPQRGGTGTGRAAPESV